MLVSLGAVICALCPCETQLLRDHVNSASSISGLPRCVGNISLVTTALFCFDAESEMVSPLGMCS